MLLLDRRTVIAWAAIIISSFAYMAAGSCVAYAAESAASSGASDDALGAISEVVVTAQRRSELARDVPLSITTQTGDQLEKAGITDTAGLETVTPGLKMMRTGAYTQPTIRGISTLTTQVGNDANVAMYVDGVYQPSQAVDTFDLPDVDRVEVLKGPQGTLFGRNATGGAIRIITLDPTYQTTGKFEAGYSSFNTRSAKGFISSALVPNAAAFSLSGYYSDQDGYYRDLLNDDKRALGTRTSLIRGKLLLNPADGVKLVVTTLYSHREDPSASAGFPLDRNTVDINFPGAIISSSPYRNAYNIPPVLTTETYGASARLEANVGSGQITATSSYQKYKTQLNLDATFGFTQKFVGTNYYLTQPERAITQEVTYASDPSKALSFVVGTYYYDYKGSYFPIRVQNDFPPGAFDISIYSTQTAKAYSFFGEAYYQVFDPFKIILGGRFSSETRKHIGAIAAAGAPAPGLYELGDHTWNSFTPRTSFLYSLTPTTNLYFTYSEGFKSGGFDTTVVSPQGSPPEQGVKPEKLRAYELGIKSRVAKWLEFSAATFYYDYSDIQVQSNTSVNGVPLGVLQNAAKARVYGVELDGTATVYKGLSVRTGVELLNAKYSDFPDALVTQPTGFGGNRNVQFDATGSHLVRAPDVTLTLTGNYETPLAGGLLNLSSTLYASSWYALDSASRIQQPGYATVGARGAWSPNNSGLTVALWGQNLTDRRVYQALFSTELADGVAYDPPRSFGVTVDYNF